MNWRKLLPVIASVFLLIIMIIPGCADSDTTRLKVVTSTSHLEQLVEAIGGESVDVINIVPPASHPGDFDASPGDIKKLADADLFLWHNWPGEVYVPALIESADNPDMEVITIEIQGSWMTPPVQLQAIDKVTAALSQVDAENAADYENNAESYKEEVQAAEEEVKAILSEESLSEVNVLCAGWQAGFVGWCGFNVVKTYGLPVPPTLGEIEELIGLGIEAGVSLVIDNLHDNPDAGKPIATELGCRRVILYNFPGVDESTETWIETFKTNVDLVLKAISE
ncbi:MAG: zinc ABC transporter substrate-binding protein [Dehalococcoidales bacterium]|nr:MAG: zinc ABC transporter substrate-binding protein [Dehalococcoidales bacterium]